VLTKEAAANLRASYKAHLEDQLSTVGSHVPTASTLQKQWSGMAWHTSNKAVRNPVTGVEGDILREVGQGSVTVPDGFVSASHVCLRQSVST
jgi:probable 2-oxoglutarate dehydrogenase E1 component DHKTD1